MGTLSQVDRAGRSKRAGEAGLSSRKSTWDFQDHGNLLSYLLETLWSCGGFVCLLFYFSFRGS